MNMRRQEWETVNLRFRFYDDFEIDNYRSHYSRSEIEIEESETKEILVDKFLVRPSSPPPSPQQPPAPPPPPPPTRSSPVNVSQKLRKTHRSVRNREVQEKLKRIVTNSDSNRFKEAFQPPPSPPPPPPPQTPFVTATPPRKHVTLQRRNRKKKIQKIKRKERSESLVVVETEPPEPPRYQKRISRV
ncbi:unnamed protein product [Cochlearia groenlandica]